MNRVFYLVAFCAALAGCGDGSSENGSVSGGSIQSGSTSSASLNTGELKPTSDATFLSTTMDLVTTGGVSEANGIITGGMTSNRLTTIDTPNFSASYNAGYRLADSLNNATFGSGQLVSDTTRVNGMGSVLFSSVSGSTENYLARYQATVYSSSSKGMGYTTAAYGGVGGWQHTVVNGSSRQNRLDYFAFGSATPITAMPHSGKLKFSLTTQGNYATDTDLWFLSGSSGDFITIDFGAGTVSGNMSLSGQNFYKSVVGGIGYIPLQGTISGNTIIGSIPNGDLGVSGRVPTQFRILFIGPNANELIITFAANDGTQAAVGASVGLIDPYFQ